MIPMLGPPFHVDLWPIDEGNMNLLIHSREGHSNGERSLMRTPGRQSIIPNTTELVNVFMVRDVGWIGDG